MFHLYDRELGFSPGFIRGVVVFNKISGMFSDGSSTLPPYE